MNHDAITLEDMAATPTHWPILSDLFRSGSVSCEKMGEIFDRFTNFWVWHHDQQEIEA